MPKTLRIVGISLFCALALLGCDLFANTDFSQVKGEWTFPNISQINNVSVYDVSLSVLGDSKEAAGLDIRWTRSSDEEYFLYMADGAMNGDTFTGTYRLNSDWDTIHSLTVKFSKVGDTLKIECSGTGGLAGITLTGGIPAVY
jgi:hypothetical protein